MASNIQSEEQRAMTQKSCWCGNTDLTEFSPEYARCNNCGTLNSIAGLSADLMRVRDDERDFYSKEYWLSHQTQDYGFPDIYLRSRVDLPERSLYWLRTLMAYRLPPAKVLELGCAHGGSVALMNWAGFDATGLELSPWVVDFAKKTFEIPMVLGPLEDAGLSPATFDVIVLYDVLEHLPDPLATMRAAASLLTEEGIFVVQTPNYTEDLVYAEMVEWNDRFLDQMKAIEHIHLFSHRSISQFFKQLGFGFLAFEKQLFDYDMYFVASRQQLVCNTEEQIAHDLLKRPSGRIVQALIDSSNNIEILQTKYQESERDRAARLEVIIQQGQKIDELQAQRQLTETELNRSQLATIDELQAQKQLAEAELHRFQLALEEFQAREKQLQELYSSESEKQLHSRQTIAKHQQELAIQQAEIAQQQQEVDRLQQQNKVATVELQQVQSQLAAARSKIDRIQQEQLQEIYHQVERTQQKIDDTNIKIARKQTWKFWQR
jgi:2-polyprenyl-3-methyl-5-hydroxy-6-metoxy-1,4-benzoquinol methylase